MSVTTPREPVRYRFWPPQSLRLSGAARASQCLVILATGQRLLMLHEGGLGSVWFPAIRQMHPVLGEVRGGGGFQTVPP